jgi:hypothetical protein
MSRPSGCGDRESEIVAAIDPKRGIRPTATQSNFAVNMA